MHIAGNHPRQPRARTFVLLDQGLFARVVNQHLPILAAQGVCD